MNEPISIIVTEKTAFVRGYLVEVLKKYNLNILAETGNGREVLEQLKIKQPDVILLDLEIKGIHINKLFNTIRKIYPEIKIIISSNFYIGCLKTNYLKRGAYAYIHGNCKGEGYEVLYEAIVKAKNGEKFYCTHDSDFHLTYPYCELEFTEFEVKLIPLLYQRASLKTIAGKFKIKESEAKQHRNNIFDKTDTKSKLMFIRPYIEMGLEYLGN